MLYTIKILYGYPTGFNITSAFRDHLAHINLYKFNSIYIPLGTTTRFSIFTVVQHRTKFHTRLTTISLAHLQHKFALKPSQTYTPRSQVCTPICKPPSPPSQVLGWKLFCTHKFACNFLFNVPNCVFKKNVQNPKWSNLIENAVKCFHPSKSLCPMGLRSNTRLHNMAQIALETFELCHSKRATCHLYVYILNLPAKVNTMSRRSFKISHAAGQAKKTRAYVCKLPHP